MAKPTINDVAAKAGVSRQTVSNVLNAPHRVKPSTLAKVQHTIDELGYRIHQSARRLRTQRSSTIGIRLDPDSGGISGAVLDRFIHAFTEQSSALGLRILLFTAQGQDENIQQMSRLIDDGDVDAFLLTSTVHNDPRITWLAEQNFPFACFGRPWGLSLADTKQVRWADVDGRFGTFEATTALLKSGYRNIAYLGWPAGSGTGDERAQGWYHAMVEDQGSTQDVTRLLRAIEDRTAEATEATNDLLAHIPDLGAIVCASDTLALGAHLATRGSVPIVGFDDTPLAAALEISSIRQPITEVATTLLRQLGYSNGEDTAPADSTLANSTLADGGHTLLAPTVQWRGKLAEQMGHSGP